MLFIYIYDNYNYIGLINLKGCVFFLGWLGGGFETPNITGNV